MLKFLSIRNFAIVELIELEFNAGFTALTGETGAGKSILIDALSLALGERSDATMVRTNCERAEITAEFNTRLLSSLQNWLIEQDLQGDANTCLLRRVIDSNGRSRGFINGSSVTLQQMREVGEQLIDIHGQHAHQSLLRPNTQRDLVDGYAGLQTKASTVAQLYREWQSIMRHRVQLEQNKETVAAERELLQFQCRELAALNFDAATWVELQADHSRLSHAASLLETAQLGIEILTDADTACLTQLNTLASRIRAGLEFDASLKDTLSLLESAQNELQEAAYALRHYQQSIDIDPQKSQEQELIIAAVIGAARKYRVTPEQLPEVLQRCATRLNELKIYSDLDTLAQQENVAKTRFVEIAQELSVARKKAAAKLSREISASMQNLAMQGGQFQVVLHALPEGSMAGLETIEFQVSTNPGAPLRALAKVASGGELARISLAIQVATSQAATVPTLIFDEVDSGIGGRVAEIVGQLLKRLGGNHQVMCVTHLPQVAATADTQLQVLKSTQNGATLSSISVLKPAERIEEIARMLGGIKITDASRKHAAEMLGRSN